MIDSIDALAFTLHQNKGAFALLLGSGISRSAMIPTGWDIILDLTRKLARARGANCDADPASWYRQTFSEEPNYSRLLQALAKSPAERSQLLRGYFEASDEERDRGEKEPTPAHRAIGRLVAMGYIRVIVTTNFDRLLEKAIEDAGVVPVVLSTTDALVGALPLQHSTCTIVKVHGDYLDTRIRNTPSELERYPQKVNSLLDRVFDEYGLIVCGWSGEWDTALRDALERCKSHRFTTYWSARSKPSGLAANIISLRRAEFVPIRGADEFFAELVEKIQGLEELDRPQPLSVKLLVATLKRYLTQDVYRIALSDLVIGEVDSVRSMAGSEYFPYINTTPYNGELVNERLERYRAICERLQAVMMTGCLWSEERQNGVWVGAMQRLSMRAAPESVVNSSYYALTKYPSLHILYSSGMASLVGERYSTLAALLLRPMVQGDLSREFKPLAVLVNSHDVLHNVSKMLRRNNPQWTPVSDYLHETLRPAFLELVPDDVLYDRLFNEFEYILALVNVDLVAKYGERPWPILGRFCWRDRYDGQAIWSVVGEAISSLKESWPLLAAGLFEGSMERLSAARAIVDNKVQDWKRGPYEL